MKLRALSVLGTLLAACGGAYDGDSTETDTAYLSAPDSRDVCTASGKLDFQIRGRSLTRLDGRRVVAAAFENDALTGMLDAKRIVLRSGVIRSGGFSLSCAHSLHQNYAYPSWAVFVDADGNGVCGNGDLGYQMQLYGWDRNVIEEIPSTDWIRISTTDPLGPPLGSKASDFCSGYFQ